MPKFKLGKKAKDAFMLPISLPSGLVDLKGHCKVNGAMALSDEEAAFALKNGLQKYIDQDYAAVVGEEVKPVKPAEETKKPEPKKEDTKESAVETKEEMPVIETEAEVEEEAEVEAEAEVESDESQEEKGKSSKKRSKKG